MGDAGSIRDDSGPDLPVMVDSLKKRVSKGAKLYAIVDSAIYPPIHDIFDIQNPPHAFLLKESHYAKLWRVAPYLVELEDGSETKRVLLEEGLGSYWLTLIATPLDIDTLSARLKELIAVYSKEHEKGIVFRFYDPRNIEKNLKIRSIEQREEIFRSIEGLFAFADFKEPKKLHIFDKDTAWPDPYSEAVSAALLTKENMRRLDICDLDEYLSECAEDLAKLNFPDPYPKDKKEYRRFAAHVYEVAVSYGLDNQKYAFALMLAWHVHGRAFIEDESVLKLLRSEKIENYAKYQIFMDALFRRLQNYEKRVSLK